MGAVIAGQWLGWIGFTAFSLFELFVMTDNRLGANGGGAIGLGLAWPCSARGSPGADCRRSSAP